VALAQIGADQCAAAVAPGRVPVLVDVNGRYKGAKVFVVAVPSATPNVLDVFITGPDCTTGHPHVLSQARSAAN
jgi:hypothetical protein